MLKLYKASNGYWYIHYPNLNTNKKNRISCKTKDKVKANDVFKQFRARYTQEQEQGIRLITLTDFIDFISNPKNMGGVSLRVVKQYKQMLVELSNLYQNLLLNDIKQWHIDSYKNYLTNDRNLKDTTVKNKLVKLLVCLNIAKKNGYISNAVSYTLPKLKIVEVEKDYLNNQELQELLNNNDNQDLKDIILFTFLTGLRLNEVTNLTRADINLESKFLTLNNKTHVTKSKRIRTVPLTNTALEIISRRLQYNDNDFIFTYKGKAWQPITLQYNFKQLSKKTFGNNKQISFHSLRHSFASNLAISNIPIYTISNFLGHANISTTQKYSHLSNEHLRNSINMIDTFGTAS